MLANKISQLERDVATADRIARFWRKQLNIYGEPKTEAFYISLGLNHLEKKQYEWEGMTLSREPTDAEKLCIKSIATAQDSSKAGIGTILLKLRTDLIDAGMIAIKKLEPADYHTLILEAPKASTVELRTELTKIFKKGRSLVSRELAAKSETKQDLTQEDDQELDDLTDLTDSRVINDVQSRITAAAARFALLGLAGAALWKAVSDEVSSGSVSYIDRAATGLANTVLNFGRSREAEDRSNEWDRVEYSAILDANTCSPCAADDGQTARDEADLTDVPNPDCEGGDWCRCFHVFINQ